MLNLGIIKEKADKFVSLLKNFLRKMICQQAFNLWLMCVMSVTKVKFGAFSVEVFIEFLFMLDTNLFLICNNESFDRKKHKGTDFAEFHWIGEEMSETGLVIGTSLTSLFPM
jgi:hypothetical protein